LFVKFEWIDKIQQFLVNAISSLTHLEKHKNLIFFVRWCHKGPFALVTSLILLTGIGL